MHGPEGAGTHVQVVAHSSGAAVLAGTAGVVRGQQAIAEGAVSHVQVTHSSGAAGVVRAGEAGVLRAHTECLACARACVCVCPPVHELCVCA